MNRMIAIRLDAPLISFGAPMVDQLGVIQRMPALSQLTGLLANALGYRHGEHSRLSRLQERLRFAARIDRAGELVEDYQIVDLGKPWMDSKKNGWTTRGALMTRAGASGTGLHIRHRHYRADSLHTVTLNLESPDESPSLDHLGASIREPARPLFIGRKNCLPAAPMFLGFIEAPSLLTGLARTPRFPRSDDGPLEAWWDAGESEDGALSVGDVVPVTDERDWRNQIHVGRRLLRYGHIDPPPPQEMKQESP